MDDLTLWTAIALMALGLGAGTYGTAIGAGGGFIVSPLLIILFHLDHNVAVGTSLATVFLGSISASVLFLRRGMVDLRSVVLFSLAAIPGTILGIAGLNQVSGPRFQLVFGVFLLLVGLLVLLRHLQTGLAAVRAEDKTLIGPSETRNPAGSAARHAFGSTTRHVVTARHETYDYAYNEPAAVMVNGGFGFISGFFGIGAGPMRTPALIYLFHFPLHIAIATSIVSQLAFTAVGSAGHLIEGNVNIPVALLVGGGMLAGAQLGVGLLRIIRARWIQAMLSIASLGMGAQLIVSGVRG